jgi:F-type H+-transporting ATPase subunit b
VKPRTVIAVLALLFGFALLAQEHAPAAHAEDGQPVSAKVEHEAGAENEGNLEIWKWANFLILAGVLGWMIAKNAPAFFQSRTEEIQKGIAEATRLKEEAEARATKMEMQMASLTSEIEHLRADARAEMAKETERIRREAEQQMARLQARGQQEIVAITNHAQKDLKAYTAALAVQLAAERIHGRMSGDTQNSLFDGFLRQLDRKAGSPEARS